MSPEKPLCEGVKVKSKLQCGTQMVEVPKLGRHWREAASVERSE